MIAEGSGGTGANWPAAVTSGPDCRLKARFESFLDSVRVWSGLKGLAKIQKETRQKGGFEPCWERASQARSKLLIGHVQTSTGRDLVTGFGQRL